MTRFANKTVVITGGTSGTPAKRFGEPEEVATAIAFLASGPAPYIAGMELAVDASRTQL